MGYSGIYYDRLGYSRCTNIGDRMPSATGTATAKKIIWGSTQNSVNHFDIYRREDSVSASLTTADIVAKVGYGTNHYVDSTDNAPYWYWVKAITWAGNSSAFSDTITGLTTNSLDGEPCGFLNRTSSVLTWDNGTRTLSISPAGTYFNYFIGGVTVKITSAKTVQVPNTSTLSYIYFDDAAGTLVSTSSYTSQQLRALIINKPLVAAVYYNTAGTTVYYADERHGIQMPGQSHAHDHFVDGFRLLSGGALGNITADQTGASNTHAQFGVTGGLGVDEDLDHTLNEVLSTTGCKIWYKLGTLGKWVSTTNAGYSFLVSGTPLLYYNEWTGATWQLSEVTNNQFSLVHIFATNNVDTQYISILGQADYNTLTNARLGAATDISNLVYQGLPDHEYLPLGTIILQTSNTYGNTPKVRVRSYDASHLYVDWRTTVLTPGTGPSDHGSLSGLGDDDHPQYLILNGRGGVAQSISGDVTMGNALTVSGAVTMNSTLAVSGSTTIDGATILKSTLTVSGACTLNSTLAVTGAVTLHSTLAVSGATTLNGLLNVSGALTVDGATLLKSTLGVSGEITCRDNISNDASIINCAGITTSGALHASAELTVSSFAIISSYLTVGSYIEITAQASNPATPASEGMVRLFAKASGGVTKFCMIDTAATVTQFGSGGAGASVALDNLDTVAINTSLVSDTHNTDDIGTTSTRWKDIYCRNIYLGTAGTTNGIFPAIGTPPYIPMVGHYLPLTTDTWDMGNASYYWKALYAVTAYITKLYPGGGAAYLHASGAHMGITGGGLDINEDLVVSGHCSIGTEAALSVDQVVMISEDFDGVTGNNKYGIYMNPTRTPSNADGSLWVGVGGYNVVGNTNKVGISCGLAFGPYNKIATTTGSTATSTTLIGVDTWGGRGYNGTMNATDIIGLRVIPTRDDGAMTGFNASACTGILIENGAAAGTINKAYQLRIASPTHGTNNRQVFLDGANTATDGIWFNGDSGVHMGYDSTGYFYIATLNNAAGTYAMRYNTSTKEVSYTSSNRDSKTNIRDWEPDITKVLRLRPRKFEYKTELGREAIGYIAEEVDELGLNELVDYECDKPMNVRYDKVCMYLIDVVKKQQGQINELKERLDGLERKED